jgi:hypothetical protein
VKPRNAVPSVLFLSAAEVITILFFDVLNSLFRN